MHIKSINNSNPNFNGSYCFKGPWTATMRETTEPLLKELAKGNKDIIANMSTKRTFFSRFHKFGEVLYKPSIIAQKENMTFIEKIKNKLGILPKRETEITSHYHRESSTQRLLKERLIIDKFILWGYRRNLDINE